MVLCSGADAKRKAALSSFAPTSPYARYRQRDPKKIKYILYIKKQMNT